MHQFIHNIIIINLFFLQLTLNITIDLSFVILDLNCTEMKFDFKTPYFIWKTLPVSLSYFE